ncbi:MAG TPA: pantoate--beta-alanine ligase, partial [Candidatus Limnocylindrales bacterium]|nr:pantoate--beta-alanine ligase [Candidatus Limnocylindrales bacterium]
MQIIESVADMRQWSERQRRGRQRIVLVPTMGFLHEGHLGLMRQARQRGDLVVTSIFVNPAQFGPGEDFATYPRDLERDRRMLEAEGVDVLFHPSVEELYPAGAQTFVQVEKLSMPLCGAARPGHFRGVATVVAKLFNIVRPHVAIFGEKDYQQLQVIRRMVRDLSMDVEIVGHPIVRERDGLAMSSRNAYLNSAQRQAALCLSRALCKAERLVRRGETNPTAIVDRVRAELNNEPLAAVEYVKLCDVETLDEIDAVGESALLA